MPISASRELRWIAAIQAGAILRATREKRGLDWAISVVCDAPQAPTGPGAFLSEAALDYVRAQ